MKNSILLLSITLFFVSSSVLGQSDTTKTTHLPLSTPKRAQAIYGGIMGEGLVFSVNYDTRFNKSDKGLGMHVGLGYFGLFSYGVMTLPVGLNYLGGKAPNYLEVGLGVTMVKEMDGYSKSTLIDGTAVMPTIGYRYQTEKNGFTARFVITPLFNPKDPTIAVFYGGIGFGYKF